MTRINVVPVQELSRQHLIAEYREITRLPGNLKKSLNRKTKQFSMLEIPEDYTLGAGHVKFFYNKMKFLENRFIALFTEMQNRGYTANHTDPSIFHPEDMKFYKDYKPSEKALEINRQRILERSVK